MRIFWLLFFSCPMLLVSQVNTVEQDSTELTYYLIEGDTIPRAVIDLDEVVVLPSLKLRTKKERIRYLILRRKTLKVFPYAKLAAERLVELNERLSTLKKRRDKKKYAKRVQKYIEEEFSAELKKLTRTEGQILVKLIHRQTGKTTFALIKELRNGWRAFWFNNTAKLFDISLKKEFNPLEAEEDYLIEDILQRAFQSDILKFQAAAFPIDFYESHNKWQKNK